MAEPGTGTLRLARPAAAALLVVLVGYPLLRLATTAGEDGWSDLAATVEDAAIRRALFNSVWTSTAAASIATVAGLAGALLTERGMRRGAGALRLGLIGTLIVPPFVTAVSWQAAFAPFGLIDDLTGVAAGWLEGPGGVVAVVAVSVMPLAYIVVAASLRSGRTADLERAARIAGAGPVTTLRTITLPLLRPAVTAGWLVAFAGGMSSFGVPVVLGTPAGFDTLTTRIFRALTFSAQAEAFRQAVVMALMLAVVALVVAAVADARAAGGGPAALATPIVGRAAAPLRRPGGLVAAAWAYVMITLGIPLLALVLRAVTRAVGLAPVPANWTTANFTAALDGRTWEALRWSSLLALLAAALAVLGGGAVAAAAHGGRRGWGAAAAATFALPGSALAVAVLLAYGSWLADTAAIILVAYLAKLLALAHRPIAGSMTGLHPDLVRAGRASGGRPVTVLRRIVLPLLRPALLAGFLLVFLFAFHELTMSSLLHGPGNETLAVVVLDYQQIGDTTTTAALAVVLTGLVAVVAAPLLWLRRVWGLPG